MKRYLPETGRSNYGVSRRSALRLHLLPFHVNALLQSFSKTGFCLYAHDTCILVKHGDVSKPEFFLNKEFSLLYEWFIQNELSIRFLPNQDQTKCILFSMVKGSREINIFRANLTLNQEEKQWLTKQISASPEVSCKKMFLKKSQHYLRNCWRIVILKEERRNWYRYSDLFWLGLLWYVRSNQNKFPLR